MHTSSASVTRSTWWVGCVTCRRSTAMSLRWTATAAAPWRGSLTAHARGVGRRSRRGILAARRGRELRGAARAWRRHSLDGAGDARRWRRRSSRGRRAPSRLNAPPTAPPRSKRNQATDSTVTRSSPRSTRFATPAEFPHGSVYTRCRLSLMAMLTRTSLRARRGSPRSSSHRRGGGRIPRAWRFRRASGRRYLGPAAAQAWRCARTATSSPSRERSCSRSSSAHDRSTISISTGANVGIRALGVSNVTAVVLSASALFLDRPMPPAGGLVDAGAAIALATDFSPGSSFCESLALCSLAATQLKLSLAEALPACIDRSGLAVSRLPPRRPCLG
jgi:hypothetical protein